MESHNMPMSTIPQRAAGLGSRGSRSSKSAAVRGRARCLLMIPLTLIGACATPRAERPAWPDVSPLAQPATDQVLELDPAQVQPMYQELYSIDLATVIDVARAENFDILLARQQVEASKGAFQSAVGSAFPVIAPTALFEWVDGTVRATEGNLVGVGFNTFQPSIVIDWVINPGQVIYQIIAAKKRMHATEQREKAVIMDALRMSVVQYYDLILAQAQVEAARQSVDEAEELLRITRVRAGIGTGVPADELRAEARLAERKQDLAKGLNAFYRASVALALTLHLDATVTLVPRAEQVAPTRLVRTDLDINQLLVFAVQFRPDLESILMLAEAAADAQGATWWGALGLGFQVGYQYGGITGHANNVIAGEGIPSNLVLNPFSPTGSFSGSPLANGLIKESVLRGSRRAAKDQDQSYNFKGQQRASARAGWRLSASMFGDMKSASAAERQAVLRAERQLDQVRAEVVVAAQASDTNSELIGLANQQVVAAVEALRLTQANFQAGTMTTLDVLQAQDAASQARLRYAEAVVRYNQSEVDLLASLGLIDERGRSLRLAKTMRSEEDADNS